VVALALLACTQLGTTTPCGRCRAVTGAGHLDDATACSPLRSVAVSEPGIAAESVATEAGGGQYADLTELFCTAERCPVIVGNTLVNFHQGHIALEYARLLAPVLGALADRTLIQR
jgi:hypothetical protein